MEEAPTYEPDKIALLKKEYEEQLELNKDAIERFDDADMARSAGYMDGMSRACWILTGEYITELIK